MNKFFDVKYGVTDNSLVTIEGKDIRVDVYIQNPEAMDDGAKDTSLWFGVSNKAKEPMYGTMCWKPMEPNEYFDAKLKLMTSATTAEVTAIAIMIWFKYNALYQLKAATEAYAAACKECQALLIPKPRAPRSKNTSKDEAE